MKLMGCLVALLVSCLWVAADDTASSPSGQTGDDVMMEYVNSAIKLYFTGHYQQSVRALRDVLKEYQGITTNRATNKAHDFLASLTFKHSGTWVGHGDGPEYWAEYHRQRMSPNEFLDFLRRTNFNWQRLEGEQRVRDAEYSACLNNLRLLDAASESWAAGNRKGRGEQVTASEVRQSIKGGTLPVCPSGGKYSLPSLGLSPRCSFHGVLWEGQSSWPCKWWTNYFETVEQMPRRDK